MKTVSYQLEGQAKTAKQQFKKMNKKTPSEAAAQFTETLEDIKQKQEKLQLYFETYRDQKFHKWLSQLALGMEAQQQMYTKGHKIFDRSEKSSSSNTLKRGVEKSIRQRTSSCRRYIY